MPRGGLRIRCFGLAGYAAGRGSPWCRLNTLVPARVVQFRAGLANAPDAPVCSVHARRNAHFVAAIALSDNQLSGRPGGSVLTRLTASIGTNLTALNGRTTATRNFFGTTAKGDLTGGVGGVGRTGSKERDREVGGERGWVGVTSVPRARRRRG